MPTFVSPFTGTVVTPTDVSYEFLSFNTPQQLAWPASVNDGEVVAARIIDCMPLGNNLTIALPPANEGTTGADILFRNLGGSTFYVTDSTGYNSIEVLAGISKYVYLTDNTTAAGTWNNVTFAAGTSVADALTLAGLGLSVNGTGKLQTSQIINEVAIAPTLTDASRAATYVWTSGIGTFTLPAASSLTEGWYIAFRNSGTGTLTIAASGSSTINDSIQIETNPGDSGFVMFDSTTGNFSTIGYAPPTNVSFTAATYDVDAVPTNTLSLVSYAPIIQTYIAQSGTRTQTLNVVFPAITQVYMLVNNTNQPGYGITFQNEGSSQPPITLAAGEVSVLLSDGSTLYPLLQSTTNIFYADNGSAAVPSYSFAANGSTGMYLANANILGLSANGINMALFDNTNTSAPVVKIAARLNAQLISGGTF